MQDTLSDRLDRHLSGEQVTTDYLDLRTHQRIHVPMGEGPPPASIPFLGEVNASEEPVPALSREDQLAAAKQQFLNLGPREREMVYAVMRVMIEANREAES